jgi:hypothetical protein
VVFSDRPMAMMDHPETGERVWDFTVERIHIKPNRVKQISHPYRQNRDPDMRERGWVKKSRARFAAIVNNVMVENGLGVRYDPRSYKDMGLDVTPMANVSRILTDKSKTRSFVVMDAEWTRRMIDAEMQEAALRRDDTYQQLREVERQIQEGARKSKAPKLANEHLPKGMRLSPGHKLTPWMAERLSAGLLEMERERLACKFIDEATGRALSHVIEATGPRRGRMAAFGPNAPDAESLTALNKAAREEMAAFEATRNGRNRGFRLAGKAFMDAWNKMSGAGSAQNGPGPAEDPRPSRATGAARGQRVAGQEPGENSRRKGPTSHREAAATTLDEPGRRTRGSNPEPTRTQATATADSAKQRGVCAGQAEEPQAGRPGRGQGAAAMAAAMEAAAAGYNGQPDPASVAAAARAMAAGWPLSHGQRWADWRRNRASGDRNGRGRTATEAGNRRPRRSIGRSKGRQVVEARPRARDGRRQPGRGRRQACRRRPFNEGG